jgi:non-ribosomal peptide synthetase component F
MKEWENKWTVMILKSSMVAFCLWGGEEKLWNLNLNYMMYTSSNTVLYCNFPFDVRGKSSSASSFIRQDGETHKWPSETPWLP